MIDSTVLILAPADPLAVFHAARAVTGLAPKWQLFFTGPGDPVRTYKTGDDQGADATVSVHFPATPGPYIEEDDDPPWHVLVVFGNRLLDGDTQAALRERHAGFARDLGRWLGEAGLPWCWRYEDDPGWTPGEDLTKRVQA